jgi:peptidyl-dipeptidase Dcp
MKKLLLLPALALVGFPAEAQERAAAGKELNPFLAEWTTPFGAPPFGQIRAEHFLPAFREAMARMRQETEAIAKKDQAPTFANTVEALDQAGLLLAKVSLVFWGLVSAETNDALEAIAKEVAPLLSALNDDIRHAEALFKRLGAVWGERDRIELTAEQKTLLRDTYRKFVRDGAGLVAEQKKRLRAVNAELAELGVRFQQNVLKETNAFRLVLDKKEDLAGLPEPLLAAAATAAAAAGLDGKWVFTLHAPSLWPFLQHADNRELRRRILTAYLTRGDHGDDRDNKAVVARISALRALRAKLVGYETHADYVLEENMAKTPAAVQALLGRLWAPALARAKREAADLQARIKEEGRDFALEPWDWRYYAEKVRRARYALDEQALRPYFPLEAVREGAFQVARQLFGISFGERRDIPTYHPEVRAFEVRDRDGSHLGVFLTDYHPRPGKRGGAWSGSYRTQWVQDGRDVRPIVVNVGNFSKPAGNAPALLSQDEVRTLFHELGHGLRSLLSRWRYRGHTLPRDFVELPSQIMENWALEPAVLRTYAKHWKTGEVIPDELVAKIESARLFDQGFATVEYLAAAFLDLDWHTRSEAQEQDVTGFEKRSLAKIGLPPEIAVRYRSPYFAHIFGTGLGYSAGYYSYIWSAVLDADAFQLFKEKGLFDPATAASFRANILERGGSEDPMVLYRRFRGAEPSVEPLLVRRGLK